MARVVVIFILFLSFSTGYSQTQSGQNPEQVSIFQKWWGNFISYFNAYYNANLQYEQAVKKIYKDNATSVQQVTTIFPTAPSKSSQVKEFNNVIAKCSDILTSHPYSDLSDNALLLSGKSYYQMLQYPAAERKFRELISNYPTSELLFDATLFLSRTYLEQNKNDEALALINGLISRVDVPNEVKGEANLIIAERFFLVGDYESAKPFVDIGIELFDDNEANARAVYLMGHALTEDENYQMAIPYLEQVKALSEFPGLWYWAAVDMVTAHIGLGLLTKAEAYINELIENDEMVDYKSYLLLPKADILIARAQFEEAEEILKTIIESDEKSQAAAPAFLRLGELTEKTSGDIELARYFYGLAVKANSLDSSKYIAINKEKVLEEYIQLRLELSDLQSIIQLGILPPPEIDSTLADSLSQTVDNEPANRLRQMLEEDKEVAKPSTRQRSIEDSELTSQTRFNPGQERDRSTSTPSSGQRVLSPFDPVRIRSEFLSEKFISKYGQAKDSTGMVQLRIALENGYVKLVEYFYFKTSNMDSVIANVSKFQTLFPDSERLARLLYAKSAAHERQNNNNASTSILQLLADNFTDTIYGTEARKRLGIPDSSILALRQIESNYQEALASLESGNIQPAKKILLNLQNIDSSLYIYPQILYALGYIAEIHEKDWKSANAYYSKIIKEYSQSFVGKELKNQLSLDKLTETISPNGQIEPSGDRNGQTESENEDDEIGLKETVVTEFFISNEIPTRFKRQPKLANLSW